MIPFKEGRGSVFLIQIIHNLSTKVWHDKVEGNLTLMISSSGSSGNRSCREILKTLAMYLIPKLQREIWPLKKYTGTN